MWTVVIKIINTNDKLWNHRPYKDLYNNICIMCGLSSIKGCQFVLTMSSSQFLSVGCSELLVTLRCVLLAWYSFYWSVFGALRDTGERLGNVLSMVYFFGEISHFWDQILKKKVLKFFFPEYNCLHSLPLTLSPFFLKVISVTDIQRDWKASMCWGCRFIYLLDLLCCAAFVRDHTLALSLSVILSAF